MNEAFKECLKNKKIISFPRAKGLIKKELAAAKDDLTEAKDRLRNGRIIIQFDSRGTNLYSILSKVWGKSENSKPKPSISN